MASNSGNNNISQNSLNHLYLWIKENIQKIKANNTIKAKKPRQLSLKDLIFEVFDHSLQSPEYHDISFIIILKKQTSIPGRELLSLVIFKDLSLKSQCSFTALIDPCNEVITGLFFKLESQ